MIVVTRSFLKELRSFDISIKRELVELISKHARWLEKSFILLREEGDLLIYKWYLGGKRVRIVVIKTQRNSYIPLEIFKKESTKWYNIQKSYSVSNIVTRSEKEISEDLYEIWELK